MKRATLSKALISLALTMALAFGAAALAAAPARNARAEDAFTAEWLVQADPSAAITAAADGYEAGLTVDAAGVAASGRFNAVFTGDTELKFQFPTTAGWGETKGKSAVFTVTDLAGNDVFSVHYEGGADGYGTGAYLTYGDEYRATANNVQAFGWSSGIYYAFRAIYTNSGMALPYLDTQNKSVGSLSFEWEGEVLNVYHTSLPGPNKLRLAAFDGTENDPDIADAVAAGSMASTMEEINTTAKFALPKIYDRLKDGYMIRFETAGDVDIDFVSVNDENLADMQSAPAYFAAYAEKEGIAFDGAVPETAYAGGHAVQMPAAVYLDNGAVKEAALTVTDPFGEDVRVQDGVFATEGIGDYTATYTAGEKTYKYIVKAETIAMPAESALQAVNDSVSVQTGDYAGIHVDADENGISGEINGVFKGNAEVVFRLPSDLAEGDAARWRDVDFIVKDLDGKEAFRVEFSSGDGYATLPTLYYKDQNYKDQIRAGVRNSRTLAEEKWTPMIWFKGREYAGADYGTAAPSFNAKDNTKAGYISLEWEGEVLNVWYLASGDIKMKLASFDGTDTTYTVPESGYQRYESEEDLNQNGVFALPKIYDRLKDGYTISFAASASELVETLNVVSVNGVSLAEVIPVQNTTYAVEEDLSVRQNGKLSAEITYTMHFAEGWTMPTVNIVQVDVNTSALGETTGFVSDPMAAMFGLEVNNVEVPVLVREPQAAELFADMKGKLTMEEGAAIRLDEPTGLRFTARVNKAAADALSAAYGGEVSYGTLIVPQDMLEGYSAEELFNSEGVLKVASSGFYGTEGEDYIFRASIVNIKGYNYTRAFAGIAYVETADGVIFAADYEGTARSVYEVAKALYADRQDTADDYYQYEIDGMYSPYTAEELAAVKTLYIDAVAEIDDKGYAGNAMYYTAPYSVETAESDGVKTVTVTSSEVIKTVIYNGERIPSAELSFGADGKSVTFTATL